MKQVWRRPAVWFMALVTAVTAIVLIVKAYPEDAPDLLEFVAYVFFLLALVAFFRTPILTWRAWREYRYLKGHFTMKERSIVELDEADVQGSSAVGWADGRRLANQLRAGEDLQELATWDRVLKFGEQAHFDLQVDYARFSDGSWRDRQVARIVATDRRLICRVDRKWLSFYFNAVTEFYPELANDSIKLGFSNTTPLLLHGFSAPVIAVYTTWRLYGVRGVSEHPSLATLTR